MSAPFTPRLVFSYNISLSCLLLAFTASTWIILQFKQKQLPKFVTLPNLDFRFLPSFIIHNSICGAEYGITAMGPHMHVRKNNPYQTPCTIKSIKSILSIIRFFSPLNKYELCPRQQWHRSEPSKNWLWNIRLFDFGSFRG